MERTCSLGNLQRVFHMLDENGFSLLFRDAHTHRVWQPRPVEDSQLRDLYDLLRMPPTSANSQPGRFVFIKSQEAKERLKPALDPSNVKKTMTAPITTIVAYDTLFYEYLPRLFPSWVGADKDMAGKPKAERGRIALLSSALQAGYLMIAARSLGLDCGPMGGFNSAKVDETFFPDGRWKSILLVNLGYGDTQKPYTRGARLAFDEAARIL
jgi:3-hydroxypropanoate dehydrogenase